MMKYKKKYKYINIMKVRNTFSCTFENEIPSHARIFNGIVKDQIEIVKSFSKRMKIIEQIKRTKK